VPISKAIGAARKHHIKDFLYVNPALFPWVFFIQSRATPRGEAG